MFKFLANTTLFKNIEINDIETLLKNINYNLKKHKKGEYIAFKGDIVTNYMLIKSGEIRAEMLKKNGQSIEVEVLRKNQDIAPSFLFGNNNKFPVDVFVKEESEIFYLPKEELLNLIQKDKRVLQNILDSFSSKTQFLSKRLNFANKTIEEKLAIYILENTQNNIFNLKVSITNLAEIFGVSRPSLSRVIVTWVEEGILERINNKSFKLLEKSELEDKLI